MISVIIPVLNESPTVASVVEFARRSPGVTEVIVIDDGSIDGTPELAAAAGAKVVTSTLMGKGASMEDGAWAANNEVLVYLDGDLSGLHEDLIPKLSKPILEGNADFVKARFSRSAGRVTMLTAKPLILTFFPELGHFEQPLGGIIAIKRPLLRKLRFETDYGVDVALLIDIAAMGAIIEQVDIGHIQHDSQSLEQLGDMAKQVVRVILDRAGRYGRLDVQQVKEVEEVDRISQSEMSMVFQRMGQPERLALFDMDGTLLKGRFIINLAQRTGKTNELIQYLDHADITPEDRMKKIASLFARVPKEVFEEAALTIPLMNGAAEVVIALRKAGYRVGIVSDSFRVATEIVRRRVFADFSIAHVMRFQKGVATGEAMISPAMRHESGCKQHDICKMNVLLHVCEHLGLSPDKVIAIGDSDPDACMIKAAGTGIAFQPKTKTFEASAHHVFQDNLMEILQTLGERTITWKAAG
jgi:glucosyl-3-phosphoglycerate synthase